MAHIPQSSHAMLHVSVKDASITETPDFVAQSTAMGSQSVKQTISHLPRHEVVKLIPGNETDPMTAPVVHSVEVKMNSFVTSSYDKLTDGPLLLSPADTTLDLRKQTWTIPSFLPGDLVPPWWDTIQYLTPRYSTPTQKHPPLGWHTMPLFMFVPNFLPGDRVPPWWDASPYLVPRYSVPTQKHFSPECHSTPLYLFISSFLPGDLVPPWRDVNPYLAPRYCVPTQRHIHSLEWHTIPLYIFVPSFLPGYLVPPWWDASTYLAPRNSVPAQKHLPIEWHPIPLYLLVSSFLPGELVPPRWDANPYLAFP